MPKIVDHNLYRQELLSKCFDLFASKGYGSVTMREIAQGIGVSTGTLYHYFSGKEAIFLQLVEEQTKQDISNFLATADRNQPLSGRIETLFNFIAKNEDYFQQQILIWVDFCRHQDNQEVLNNEKLKQADEEIRQVLTDYLQVDELIIELIFSLIYGILMARLFEGKTISYTNQGNLLAKMLTVYLQ
ncbi:transcriptional regulator, TetR family [Gloeothece citriformis PCC 7424]|uniref:Transcriptional regulator, TetR family n=1 Tax=Gloeothece citriformis (strain PCC 7424) TaxID=65393 RepID=B7KG50_GLOC7|nr:TetR/AcrR family transcriptional regulator [Gloeothece citriformis]ACK70521.1 transcriptional regulator, TetR family [Gloeothece citriformis PCC 7424]